MRRAAFCAFVHIVTNDQMDSLVGVGYSIDGMSVPMMRGLRDGVQALMSDDSLWSQAGFVLSRDRSPCMRCVWDGRACPHGSTLDNQISVWRIAGPCASGGLKTHVVVLLDNSMLREDKNDTSLKNGIQRGWGLWISFDMRGWSHVISVDGPNLVTLPSRRPSHYAFRRLHQVCLNQQQAQILRTLEPVLRDRAGLQFMWGPPEAPIPADAGEPSDRTLMHNTFSLMRKRVCDLIRDVDFVRHVMIDKTLSTVSM